MIQESSLRKIAQSVRAFLEPVWLEWHCADECMPEVPSQGTCGRSSLFLQQVLLEDYGLPAHWVSGDPLGTPGRISAFGFLAGAEWRGHAWIEVNDRWIVDVTCDQFGHTPVMITTIGDSRYARGPKDTALPAFREKRGRAVQQLRPRWLKSRERLALCERFGGSPCRLTPMAAPAPISSCGW